MGQAATAGCVVRPSTLVILYPLLQNGIFLPGHQNSLLYIHSSRIHSSSISLLQPNYPCTDPLVSLSPSFPLPTAPSHPSPYLSLSPRVPSRTGRTSSSPPVGRSVGPFHGSPAATLRTRPRPCSFARLHGAPLHHGGVQTAEPARAAVGARRRRRGAPRPVSPSQRRRGGPLLWDAAPLLSALSPPLLRRSRARAGHRPSSPPLSSTDPPWQTAATPSSCGAGPPN
jgi:hypothetical protein